MTQELQNKEPFTRDQIELIKATVAKGATDNELKLFLHNCKRLGLDPFAKQVHFIKYGNSPGTIIVGIDGFRLVAARTGKHSGTIRGAIRDDSGNLTGAWCEVYRSDWTHPAREEVPFSEYNNPRNPSWEKMPETMIKKVAECAALRMAFPAELSGVYGKEEMDQAGAPLSESNLSVQTPPIEASGTFDSFLPTPVTQPALIVDKDPFNYVFKWGPRQGKTMRAYKKEELEEIVRKSEVNRNPKTPYTAEAEEDLLAMRKAMGSVR